MPCGCFGKTNTPAKLRNQLGRIDLVATPEKTPQEFDKLVVPELIKLFRDAHTVQDSKYKNCKDAASEQELHGWPLRGAEGGEHDDYKGFMTAVFEYCYEEYADAKKGRNQDIVHPAEIDAIRHQLKVALDPNNSKEVTWKAVRQEIKKLVDDTDYTEQQD